MIPKIIHYCWFGRKPLPRFEQACIATWKQVLPGYEIKRWDESSFDVKSNDYVREAYDAGKYAFVADYVRLWALEREGGIYLDTDVEVVRSFDSFLSHPAFAGHETPLEISTAVIASEAHGAWVTWLIGYYNGRHFVREDGSLDTTTNVKTISEMMREDGFIFNNLRQSYKGIVEVYPKDYFCPKSHATGVLERTKNTYAIHHFLGSWFPVKVKILIWIRWHLGLACYRMAALFCHNPVYIVKRIIRFGRTGV